MSQPPLPERIAPVIDIQARFDASRVAVLETFSELKYALPAPDTDDIPAFPRAGSALRRWGARRVVIQDDVNALAVADCRPNAAFVPWLLPRGAAGRRRFEVTFGNKKEKLDLEAATVLPDGRLLAFGSGSLPAREKLVLLEPGGQPQLRDAHELYVQLANQVAFTGGELNLEGALVQGSELVLLQRVNGRVSDVSTRSSAFGFLPLQDFLSWLGNAAPPPELTRIVRVHLGARSGVRFGLTDATLARDGSIVFIACAEDTSNAIDDGAVLASAWGQLAGDEACWLEIVDALGQPSRLKLEGIETIEGEAQRFEVVADVDDPNLPALGGTLRIESRGTPSP